ncbi:MAG: TIGR03759 family integrating conjugative element protein [Gammaproteobacteria bacterium]|nr:TIGR03759 family integrating conjugative element protein [Gammaproteobacteria bacterium]
MKYPLRYLFSLSLCVITTPSFAAQSSHWNHWQIKTLSHHSTTSVQAEAKVWGVSPQDYRHYQTLMQQSTNQSWYGQLDPAEVLGLTTDDATKRQYYAKLEAKLIHQRMQRELAFNQAYSNAYHALYPDEPAIRSPWRHSAMSSTLKPKDRLLWFVDGREPAPAALAQSLLAAVKSSGAVLDIYVVAPGMTAKSLQQWAIASHLPDTLIHRALTVNLGNQRWAQIQQHHRGHLPFIARLHDHHLQSVKWQNIRQINRE